MPDRPKVLIFGGGVGGLTAAHELVDRNFDVTVFEARHWGGKARSMGKPGTGKDGRMDLPGEHGFHFFPTFYRHLPDTMKRIPFVDKTVFANLVQGGEELVARTRGSHVVLPTRHSGTFGDIVGFFRCLRSLLPSIPLDEFAFFVGRCLKFMTACDERRIGEFDHISWWTFIEAGRMSLEYQQLLASLPSLLLIAVHPTLASARTLGNAFISMITTGFGSTGNIERSLNGPPSDQWVNPWVASISARAAMVVGFELVGFDFDPVSRQVRGARVRHNGVEKTVRGDYYICAVPVEVAATLMTKEMVKASPSLAGISDLCVSWMNGIQYFLNAPLPLVNGHIAFEHSAWALTSVSQNQFWQSGIRFSDYGNGQLLEVVSVIISDWDTPGTEVVKKTARDCTPDELFQETLAQMNAALSRKLKVPNQGIDIRPIPRESILDFFVDPDIQHPLRPAVHFIEAPRHKPLVGPPHRSRLYSARQFSEVFLGTGATGGAQVSDGEAGIHKTRNAEPLYITTVGAWAKRPEATTSIRNFFIASDYVRSVMDFASAEGANEAGRKSVNGILEVSGSAAPPVRIWPRDEISSLVPFQIIDRYRFEHGEPQLELPGPALDIMDRVLLDVQ